MKRSVLPAACILIIGSLTPHTLADIVTVHVFNFDFSVNPRGEPIVDPTINVGDTIHWVWDAGLHSVTTVAGSIENFDSGVQIPPATFDFTFDQPGDYVYFCIIHGFDNGDGTAGGMAGHINVVPAPASWAILALLPIAAGRRRRARPGA